jgi:hypothetical protein
MAVPLVFLRDDDVWADGPVFRELAGFLREHKIPVIYAVVPARLEAQMARRLRQMKKNDPALVDLVQHGFSHRNHECAGKDRYEFGEKRPYARQFQDIKDGMALMKRSFGRCVTPGFIPPYHAYDENTVRAIEALSIPLFSASKAVPLHSKKFIDLPASIWLHADDPKGYRRALDLPGMMDKVIHGFDDSGITGIVYRHRLIKTRARLKDMKAFLLSLARERDAGKVRFVLFSTLLRNGRKGQCP